jgi:hypothetical protein
MDFVYATQNTCASDCVRMPCILWMRGARRLALSWRQSLPSLLCLEQYQGNDSGRPCGQRFRAGLERRLLRCFDRSQRNAASGSTCSILGNEVSESRRSLPDRELLCRLAMRCECCDQLLSASSEHRPRQGCSNTSGCSGQLLHAMRAAGLPRPPQRPTDAPAADAPAADATCTGSSRPTVVLQVVSQDSKSVPADITSSTNVPQTKD